MLTSWVLTAQDRIMQEKQLIQQISKDKVGFTLSVLLYQPRQRGRSGTPQKPMSTYALPAAH